MNDWYKRCETCDETGCVGGKHRNVYAFGVAIDDHAHQTCPDCGGSGSSPVTTADLEGEKVWWCVTHNEHRGDYDFPSECWWGFEYSREGECRLVERLLIPVPESAMENR